MKSHSAEKPNMSIWPDRVLSNISGRKHKRHIQLNTTGTDFNVNIQLVAHTRAAASSLTDHQEAGLLMERRPVGVYECLPQLLLVDEATAVRVDGLEPLVRLWVNAGRDVTYKTTRGVTE